MYGGTVDGTYEHDERSGDITLSLSVTLPKGVSLIQGGTHPDETQYGFNATLPEDFAERSHVSIQTPLGPVNARFRRIRELGIND